MNNTIDIWKERGFVSQTSDETAVRRAFDAGPVTCYIGFDPTAPSFHVGNLVQIMALTHLQRNGHRPVALVGAGTAMIGDPSGKTELRRMLTPDHIDQHITRLKSQLSRYLDFDTGALLVNNGDWLRELNYIEFLREVGVHFSVNRMLAAEAYKIRMETGLTFLEFNYQVLQAYDFLMLYRNYGCTLQMGGDDQWGNILAGVDLIRRIDRGAAEAVTTPLITTADGKKMGKTAAGAIWLDAEKMSPYDYYQFWINTDDRDVERFLALFTFLPMDEVRRLGRLRNADIREAKRTLAHEATKITHGEAEALKAEQAARSVFEGQGDMENVPTTRLNRTRLEQGLNVIDLFAECGMGQSKSDVRRLIQQGGASVNGVAVTGIETTVTLRNADENGVMVLRAGKKRYHRVIIET
ncbi:MAG: tyrosine--tRNA ligase [candidate division Zixibacteria bacterium]|nr:tyrosine--tRNA ligase [candidate division Zixibacteria bacterium]